ncbi:MAG: hypothetical protein M1819_005932 [Sarea resinae]|nr:MAG: hypothetical protein M1819_005932 [Sarea resinae]
MSVQTSSIRNITLIPLASILRPIPPVLDEGKYNSMITTLQNSSPEDGSAPNESATPKNEDAGDSPTGLPPVDVLHYHRPATDEKEAKDFYFAFGGCHRLRAHQESGVDMVACRVMKVTKKMLSPYLGGSVDSIVER